MLLLIVFKQIVIMALLVAVGTLLTKRGYLSEQGSKDLGAILLRVAIPCVIVKSYITEYSTQRLMGLALSAGLALLALVLAMAVSYLIFGQRKRIENFAAAFSNAGFIGIPLVQAVIGDEGVFYLAAFIALLNLFQWTYGVYVMTGKKEAVAPKVVLKNPVVFAIVVGVLLFVTQLPVPSILYKTLDYIAITNTPIAMILLGSYMAKLSLREMLDRRAYSCVLVRLMVIPGVLLLVLWLLPITQTNVVLTAYLAAITPVGANICVFAQQYDCDHGFSVVTVCLSTVLSVLTIPLWATAAQLLL